MKDGSGIPFYKWARLKVLEQYYQEIYKSILCNPDAATNKLGHAKKILLIKGIGMGCETIILFHFHDLLPSFSMASL
jgi:hypothetical protein